MTDARVGVEVSAHDFVRTGPGTLAGRYLRSFWQPIYHAPDLPAGQARPVRVLGESFTLYRGEGGAPYLVDFRCAHRGTQLSVGWVEGECIRCFYHGWTYDGCGQCVEQPAEQPDFAAKVRIRSHPAREYLGLVFAYLGEGDPPEFPRYPEFERFEGLLELDSYRRRCNYFQNLENSLDMSHVGFVHRDNEASFAGIGHGQSLTAEDSAWGITYTSMRAEGQVRVQQFGMPNIFHMTALPTDPEIGWQESLFWWVPVDDEQHVQFSLHRVPVKGDAVGRVHERRLARRARIDVAHQAAAERILAGELRLADVDRVHVDLVRLQDDVAQVGQGRIADRERERLGRADTGVIAIRKLWLRELRALAEGRPLARWTRPPGLGPRAWRLGDQPMPLSTNGRDGADVGPPTLVDVRPRMEIEQQRDP
jgi:5,5'-dehydrodivanillate O-demethylase